jgi:hypothetical protein
MAGALPIFAPRNGRGSYVLYRLYVVVSEVQSWALSLYVLHTHAFMAAECSPYLYIYSPEKRCAKTLLMKVLALLVRSPWKVISPTEAVVCRKIEKDRPTLLTKRALMPSGSASAKPLGPTRQSKAEALRAVGLSAHADS